MAFKHATPFGSIVIERLFILNALLNFSISCVNIWYSRPKDT